MPDSSTPANAAITDILRVADDAHDHYIGDMVSLGLLTVPQWWVQHEAWEELRRDFYRAANLTRGDQR